MRQDNAHIIGDKLYSWPNKKLLNVGEINTIRAGDINTIHTNEIDTACAGEIPIEKRKS